MNKTITSKLSELFRHFLVYGLGSISQSILNFTLVPIYTKYLSTSDYGVFTLTNLFALILGAVFYFGSTSSLNRFYFDYEGNEQKKIINDCFSILLIGVASEIAIAILFSRDVSLLFFSSDKYTWVIFFAVISNALSIIVSFYIAYMRLIKKSRMVITITIFTLIFSVSGTVGYFYIYHASIIIPFIAQSIVNLCLVVFVFYSLRKTISLKKSIKNNTLFLWKFGLMQMVTSILYLILVSMDRFLINRLLSLRDLGIYSLGFLLGSSINLLYISPFSQIWTPMRLEYRNHQNDLQFYSLMFTYYLIIGLFLNYCFLLFIDDIFFVFVRNVDFFPAAEIAPIIMFGFLVYGCISFVDYGIYISQKIYFMVFGFLISILLNVLINFLFTKKFGYVIPALGFLISMMTLVAFTFYKAQKLINIKYSHGRIFRVLMIFAGFLIIYDVFFKGIALEGPIIFILKIVLIISFAFVNYKYNLSLVERIKIKELVYAKFSSR